jgi:predicted nuclease with TOPRIM domain
MPRPGYKSVYFPDEELWKKIVEEAERRKVSVYEVLKDAFECYMKEKERSNVSFEAIVRELQDLKRRVEELEKKVK